MINKRVHVNVLRIPQFGVLEIRPVESRFQRIEIPLDPIPLGSGDIFTLGVHVHEIAAAAGTERTIA